MKKYIFYLLCSIGLIYLIGILDINTILFHLKAMPMDLLFLCLFLQLVTVVLLTLQFKFIISWVKKGSSFLDVLKMNLKGNIVDSISPGVKVGGEVARIYEIRHSLNLDYGQAVVVVGLQKTISILSFLILTIVSLFWFYMTMDSQVKAYLNMFFILLLIFLFTITIFMLICSKVKSIEGFLNKVPLKDKWKERIEKTFLDYRLSLERLMERKDKFTWQILLGVFIWVLYAIKLALVIRGFNVKINFFSLSAITYISYMAGMVPLLPGGIGSFEGSMVTLLALKGVLPEKGLAISVIFRFITFWFELLISLLVLAFYKIIRQFLRDDKYVKS